MRRHSCNHGGNKKSEHRGESIFLLITVRIEDTQTGP